MLSETTLVRVRKAVESQYSGLCTVIERKKVLNRDKVTEWREVSTEIDLPCRVSYGAKSPTESMGMMAEVGQVVTLFLAPEVEIVVGSKITVQQEGRITEYSSSGQPVRYGSHQEIPLKLFQEWA